jgi:hypothetical protein
VALLLLTLLAFAGLFGLRRLSELYVRSPHGAWLRKLSRAFAESAAEKHRAKLADRLAAGEDRYFEELRELQAYAPAAEPLDGKFRVSGWEVLNGLICAFLIARQLLPYLHRFGVPG